MYSVSKNGQPLVSFMGTSFLQHSKEQRADPSGTFVCTLEGIFL